MTRPTPRRPASSRTNTQRPRKLAGQSATPPATSVEEPATPVELTKPATTARSTEPTKPTGPSEPTGPAEPRGQRIAAWFAGRRTTRTLTVLLGVAAVLLVAQGVWFAVHASRDTPQLDAPEEGTILVTDDRPVIASELAVQEGLDAAADAAQMIVSRSTAEYDGEVEAATELMTSSYAEEFRKTATDVKAEFVRQNTIVQADVVGQGVVRANDTELQALIFLNQYVQRGEGEDTRTVITQYRALLTMVHTENGWLVDELQTK